MQESRSAHRVSFDGAQIDQAAAGNIINHHHTAGRPLTKQERVELNNMVKQLETDFGEPGWQTWTFLHRTIGIERIDDMRLNHRDQAETILKLLLDRAELRTAANKKALELDQSAQALTDLTRRNSQLASELNTFKSKKKSFITPADSLRVKKIVDEYKALKDEHKTLTQRYEQQQRTFAAWRTEPCLECGIAEAKWKNWRKTSAVLAALCLLSVSMWGYQSWSADSTSTATTCLFAGESYSAGSQIVVSGQKRKCTVGSGGFTSWSDDGRRVQRVKGES